MKEIEAKKTPKDIIVKEETKTSEKWICPHCNAEIQEKSLFCNDNNEWSHRTCQGRINHP